MPERVLVSRELGSMLGVLSHPHRIRIVEELRDSELDVNSLQEILGISHSGVSQHLGVLRAHRIVLERREGRHVYYRLRQPELAAWLAAGVEFIAGNADAYDEVRSAVERVKTLWSDHGSPE
jgi:DNA-binding transcriptional ArsR family regulator